MRRLCQAAYVRLVSISLSTLLVVLWPSFCLSSPLFAYLPRPKISETGTSHVFLDQSSSFHFPESFTLKYGKIIKEVKAKLPSVIHGNAVDVYGALGPEPNYPQQSEGYFLKITREKVQIGSRSLRGLLYGLTYLEGLNSNAKGKLPTIKIVSWPDTKLRVLHLSGPASTKEIKQWIREARFAHLNSVVLRLGKPILRTGALRKFREQSQDLSLEWFLKIKDTLTQDSLQQLITEARDNGLYFIPQVDFLSHQKTFLADIYPQFMFNKATYDPRDELLYQRAVFPLLRDIIRIIGPKAVHIGHDEVAGWNDWTRRNWLGQGEKMLPAHLFLKDLKKIYSFLTQNGVEVWMWGDMLVSPEEVSCDIRHAHGTMGYSQLRKLVPKELVVCDWHYFSNCKKFDSAAVLAREGFRVIGTTWFDKKVARQFSKYLATFSCNNFGMMATTWIGALEKRFGNRNRVSEIIRDSGNIFWNAGQQ